MSSWYTLPSATWDAHVVGSNMTAPFWLPAHTGKAVSAIHFSCLPYRQVLQSGPLPLPHLEDHLL